MIRNCLTLYRPNHLQGISLVQMLIVMIIVGILITVASSTVMTTLENSRLIGATQNLETQLQYARSEAIKRGTTIYFSYVTGSRWCYGINPGTACSCNTAGSCTLGSVTANANQSLSLSTTGGLASFNSIQYESNHGFANSTGYLTFTVAGLNAMSVKVGATGSLSVCSSQISGYQPCS